MEKLGCWWRSIAVLPYAYCKTLKARRFDQVFSPASHLSSFGSSYHTSQSHLHRIPQGRSKSEHSLYCSTDRSAPRQSSALEDPATCHHMFDDVYILVIAPSVNSFGKMIFKFLKVLYRRLVHTAILLLLHLIMAQIRILLRVIILVQVLIWTRSSDLVLLGLSDCEGTSKFAAFEASDELPRISMRDPIMLHDFSHRAVGASTMFAPFHYRRCPDNSEFHLLRSGVMAPMDEVS